jgi:sulfur-oxidizing protein SoxB
VSEGARSLPGVKPVWDHVESWLKSQPGGHVRKPRVQSPRLVGVEGNPGIA